MNLLLAKLKSSHFLLAVLFLQSITYAVTLLNIPIARQVIAFLYFTFVPGTIVIKLLKLDELDRAETVLFAVGFSIAFLMLVGLLVNEFGFLLGISQPLSLMPLLTILSGFILVGGVLVCLRTDGGKLWAKTLDTHPLMPVLTVIPILSIVGAIWATAFNNNAILLFLLIAISLLFVIGVISKELLPSKIYPLAVFVIAISLLFHSSLISNYIISFGSDVPVEYFVFKTTENNAFWGSTIPYFWDLVYGRFNAMLSVTVLPTIYSNLLNIDSTLVFKILFPLIFSFVPLGLYKMWSGYVEKKYAFVSAFFFMSYFIYTELLGLNRQMIAELFFVLLLFVILDKKMKSSCKMTCFMFFSFGLVTSHYGIAQIFLFFISFALISLFAMKRPSKNITASMVVYFFVVMFAWYIFTSKSAVFDSITGFGDYVHRQLGDFFDPAARGQTVLRGMGLETPPTIWNAISRAFAYATQFLIVVGFFGLLTKRVKTHFERDYFMFTSAAMAFLAMLLLVPGLANTLNMTRFYHILLFFLAPLCVVGAEFIVKLLSKREKEFAVSALLLIVLVPYFLFQTNFVYEIAGSESWSIPLSKHRMNALQLYGHYGYIDTYSVYGAQWLSKNVDFKNSALYADETARANVLTIYGMIYGGSSLSNITIVADNGVVYLSTLNVVEGVIPFGRLSWNTSELSFIFDYLNIIYVNGGSEIYKHSP